MDAVCMKLSFRRYWRICSRAAAAQRASFFSAYDSLDNSESLGLENAAVERLPSGTALLLAGTVLLGLSMDETPNAPKIGKSSFSGLLSPMGLVPMAGL